MEKCKKYANRECDRDKTIRHAPLNINNLCVCQCMFDYKLQIWANIQHALAHAYVPWFYALSVDRLCSN